jgi:hypothetical protein
MPAPASSRQVEVRPPGEQNLDRHPNYILAAFMASGT